jgi:D-alanyl-D-alanine carboxypeptidase
MESNTTEERFYMRVKRRRFPPIGILFIVLVVGIAAAWQLGGEQFEIQELSTADPPTEETSVFTVPVNISEVTDTRYLELINRNHAINGEAERDSIVPAWPAVPVSTTEITLHNTALEAVQQLFTAARDADAGTFYVSSGYRNYERQQELYDISPVFALPPGHSEHHTGLAVDILAIGILQSELGTSNEGRWLAANAWKHGLILRYTEKKQHITGIPDEPWHFRYVGQPHAWYCHHNDLSFEEYIQFLKDAGGYQAEYDGKSYTVLYQTPQGGIIYLPEHDNYSVSGDNTGGYIVTGQVP